MPAKKVSVINFKGGVGKTTLTLHLAAHLAKKSRVLVVDIDHQSSLSIVVLGQKLWDICVNDHRTVNQIFRSYCNWKAQLPGSELVIKNAFGQRSAKYQTWYPTLDFVSAQFELDDTEIDLASTNVGDATLSDWTKRTLLAAWLDTIDADENYDYILFDCPPATKIVSQNALAASDAYVIPVIPDELSSRGVTHFRSLVETKIDNKLATLRKNAQVLDKDVPKNFVPQTRLAAIVPFLVKAAGRAASGITNIHTEQVAALRAKWGAEVIPTVGKNMIGVPEAVSAGWPVWNYKPQNAVKARPMMRSICEDLKTRIDQ